ncbi:helix-turn-helix domain-containing protein [Actinomadura rupiterrae]|uniref:helix-turn-helix domain-containing protein n=1 Tax=Actinomadura rupiterrae TaxID=559627 RepID=UPI0020A234C0|nr:helix-turn-helix domain-containing protein [Actinomadura rupiterrae]MCP2337738.1 transcriptional regulator with XRE-family HTH domain [Actinomadura rupiterrae]
MGDGAERLAALLSELKERSGLSFAELARRTHASRSTLHRYCTGTSIPDEDKYDIVLAFAKACGATPRELNDLFHHWTLATTTPETDRTAEDARPPTNDPTAHTNDGEHPPAGSPARSTQAAADGDRSAPPTARTAISRAETDGQDAAARPVGRAPTVRAARDGAESRAEAEYQDDAARPVARQSAGGEARQDDAAEVGRQLAPARSVGREVAAVRAGGVRRRDVARSPSGRGPVGRKWWRRRFLQVSGGVVAVAVLAAAGVLFGTGRRDSPGQADPGDRWTWAPWPVPPSMFGVTINSNTGTMPSFRVGAARFWDGRTRWADLEPERGVYEWAALDRLVDGAQAAKLPALFTFGGTPQWAAPDGPPTVYTDGSRAAPPDDLADWDAFVRALVHRYKGRLEAYELWDSANDQHFFNGDPRRLVAMVERASRIIKAADARATVVCPSMGRLTTPDGLRFVERFAELGGYRKCDVGGIKLFPRSSHDPPETLVPVLDAFNKTLHQAGTGIPLWDTGPNYDVPLLDQLQGDEGRDFAVRFFLVGLYGLDLDLRRTYFYNWGGRRIPVVLQAEGEQPTPAARGIETLERWLTGASVHGCGHGTAEGLPAGVWQCRFSTGTVRWAARGTATTRTGPRPVVVHRLDGTTARIPPEHALRVTGAPVFITPG